MQNRHRVETVADQRRAIGAAKTPTPRHLPVVRDICLTGARPCVYVTCPNNLYLDVNENNGSITYNFPDLEPEQMVVTCTLDVAREGGITLEETGKNLNLTRERIRQIESVAMKKLQAAAQKREIESVDFEALANVAGAGHHLSGVHAAKD